MSSGLPEAIFALMRLASEKSLSFEAACADNGASASAAATMMCPSFIFIPPFLIFVAH
ncbi:MAG TPA: hypothetical protein VN715_09970 [Roseiarcus sp.]|nr:hypothetical protein [Roseiarcus sp.]